MTATQTELASELLTVARQAWAMAVRADDTMPPLIALDWVRNHHYCEPAEALRAMRAAAAETLGEGPNEVWTATPIQFRIALRKGDYIQAGECVSAILRYTINTYRYRDIVWRPWCERAETAIRVLRELESN